MRGYLDFWAKVWADQKLNSGNGQPRNLFINLWAAWSSFGQSKGEVNMATWPCCLLGHVELATWQHGLFTTGQCKKPMLIAKVPTK